MEQKPDAQAQLKPAYEKALQDFDRLPDSANVRLPVVAALHGVSTVTVWRWSASGRLPAPIKMGGVTAWNVGALRRRMSAGAVAAAA
ncbi:MAG: DNA-binding protein [Pseudomonadota bacterium]|nr:DNA-binding protein [Pseudomonadota bacterium]